MDESFKRIEDFIYAGCRESNSNLVTISPTSNLAVVKRGETSEAELDNIINSSVSAFSSFSKTCKLLQRKSIVEKALDLLEGKKDQISYELTEQMGRPIAYTAKEIDTAIARSRYLLKICDEVLADAPGEAEEGFKRYIRKIPVGPVLIIFAWNYPYLILVNALIPALLAGDTVILKPSPQTPTIVEHIQSVFLTAGLPKDVISFFHSGKLSLVQRAVRSSSIKLICFTGSVLGGLDMQAAASHRIVPLCLELGGKDAAYVRSDADLDWTAEQLVDGAMFNSGQSCCSVERVYVHESIYEPFVASVQKVLKGYKLGDPFDPSTQIGPVISKKAMKTIQEHIKNALTKGAINLTPPNESFEKLPNDGNFVAPTLLGNVDHSMLVMKEETFGPVMPMMSVRDDDHAIELINESDFGLTGSVWTQDLNKGEELALQIEAGTVFVNRCEYPSPDLAWTGFKNSGRGVTLSKFGFDQFVKLQSVHLKAFPK